MISKRSIYGPERGSVMTSAVLLALFLSVSHYATGQPPAGTVMVTIANGTTGGPGEAEGVTLFRLASGMQPIASLGKVSGSFALENIELEGAGPYLLQVTSSGVNYNQPVTFGPGNESKASFTVFDVTQDPSVLTVRSGRFLLRRELDGLRVEKLYVVANESKPRKTFYDPQGTFRFHVPPDVVDMASVFVSSTTGMPVPQSISPLPDSSGYVTQTAFKPGTTDVTITYAVDYESGGYEIREQAYYALSQMLVLVTPADIEVEGEGWENLTPDPQSRFIVLRQSNIDAGSPIGMTLSGGSEHAADRLASEQTGPAAHGQITQLPDPSRYQKWIVVVLMGAALAYGLLAALISDRRRLKERLGGAQNVNQNGGIDHE